MDDTSTFLLFLLVALLPMILAGIVGGLDPGGIAEAINAKIGAICGYYERTRGQSGFFLKWTVRPALWLNNKLFQATERLEVDAHWKAAIRLAAGLYLVAFIALSMYLMVVLILALVVLAIGFFILSKALNWDTSSRDPDDEPRQRVAYGKGSTTRTRTDIFGRQYAEHRNADNDVIETSRGKKDFFGRSYTEHRDGDGGKAGETRTRTDIFGREYNERRDEDGNVVGTSRERQDVFGRTYVEHKDEDGNVVGESREKTDWLGRPYTQNTPKT